MFIITHRKIFYIISGVIVAASFAALAVWGLKPGIDFKGGSILEVGYGKGAPTPLQIQETLRKLGVEDSSVRQTSGLFTELGAGYIIRTRELSDAEHHSVLEALSFDGMQRMEEKRFNSIGPILGREAAGKSFVAIALVILCIVLFITFAFRKVSEPVASWKYGIITIVALLHDVLVPTGAFAILGHFAGYEVDTLFVTALLVVLGFSVHDTIVVFDRVR
jgi:preprotein translocase subunit SecF